MFRCQISPCEKLFKSLPYWHRHVEHRHPDFSSQLRSSHPSRPRANLHIILSTASGTGRAHSIWTSLLQPALASLSLQESADYTLHLTSSPSSITSLTTSLFLPTALSGHPQTIILVSGDGGPLDLLNSLLSSPSPSPSPSSPSYQSPTLILLPSGTGNALAHSSALFTRTLGLSAFFRGRAADLPFFTASFSPGARLVSPGASETLPLPAAADGTLHGAVVCSWGLHASLVADSDTEEYRRFGAERFKMAAKEALFPEVDGEEGKGTGKGTGMPHVYRGRVRVKGKGEEGEEGWREVGDGGHAYVLVAAVGELEEGFRISPESRPLDGRLWLVHFGPMPGDEVMAVMGGAYQGGTHVRSGRVGYEEVFAVRIEMEEGEERWRRVCVDGKIVRVEEGGWVEVRGGGKGVVDLVVPKE